MRKHMVIAAFGLQLSHSQRHPLANKTKDLAPALRPKPSVNSPTARPSPSITPARAPKRTKIFGVLGVRTASVARRSNEATSFVTTGDISVGGKNRFGGKYTMVCHPGRRLMDAGHQQKTGELGHGLPGPENDLARIDMKVTKTSAARRELHYCLRSERKRLHNAPGVGKTRERPSKSRRSNRPAAGL